jgi:heme O synthase-like polyprenyltransferase
MISLLDGKNISKEAYNCYQVILMQITFFFYFKNTNMQVIYAINILMILTLIGIAMIFDDDGLVGTTQLFTCPVLLLTLLFQILML